MDPALREIMALQSPAAEMEAIVKLAKAGEVPQGARVVTQFGDVATCRLQVADIEAVWSDEAVLSLKAPRAVGVELGVSHPTGNFDVPTRYNPTAFTGKGVVIGVVDWGFDFTHPGFLNPDGTTRFLAIWDQTAPADPSARAYGYGKLYTRAAINEALKSETPFSTLGYHPAKGDPDGSCAHGTHVMGIAAGNDAVGEKGLAPGAELVGVHLSAGNTSGLASLGDSVRILEAIDFIGKVAGERPLVINLSVGKHGGAHQGNSLVEQGMDNFLQEKPGRAIINSAGNYFNAQIHASGRVMPGGSATLDWEVDKNDRTPNELEIWYPNRDKMRLKITMPGAGTPVVEVALDGQQELVVRGKTVGRAYHRAKEPNTGYHHIDIFLYKNAPKGAWQITLEGIDVVDGRWHAWIERDGGCRSCQSKFPTHTADPGFTTGSICNGLYTIAVGAYDNHDPERKAAFFSSAGPTADGRKKPNLLAPGIGIRAACSARADALRSNGELAVKSGTSMAAPHVTGAIALLFEAAGQPLPIETTRRLLLSSVDSPGKDAARAMYQYGEGYLNVESLIRAATQYSQHQKPSVMKHTPVYAHEEAESPFFNDREDWYEEDGEVLAPDELDYPEDGDESDLTARWTYAEDLETEGSSAEEVDDFSYESESEDDFVNGDFDVEFDAVEDTGDDAWEYEPDENDFTITDEIEYADDKTDCGCGKHTSPEESHRGQHGNCRECGEHIVGQAAAWMHTGAAEDFLSGFFAKASVPAENYGSGNNRAYTAKNLFDRLAFDRSVPFTEAFDDDFTVVAYPKSLLTEPFLPGDVVLSRSFGEGKVWQAMAVSGTLLSRAQVVAAGLQPSSGKPGVYLEVATVQPVIRHAGAGYAKRVGDERGRLLADYMVLRGRINMEDFVSYNNPLTEDTTNFTILHRSVATLPLTGKKVKIQKRYNPVEKTFVFVSNDVVTGQAVDFSGLVVEEKQAFINKYGKLHPTLYEKLKSTDGRNRFEIAVWVKIEEEAPFKSQFTFGQLAEVPREIQAYKQQVFKKTREVASRTERLIEQETKTFSIAPFFTVFATADQINRIQTQQDVAGIFLYDREGIDNLSTSMHLSGADHVVNIAGIKGKDIKVAVWEQTPKDTTDLTIEGFWDTSLPSLSDHAQLVSGIIKNKSTTPGAPNGYAPECKLFSANSYDIEALQWAIDNRCTVVNQSFHRSKEQTSAFPSLDDVTKDYLITHFPFPFITQAAGNGNNAEYVNHKGYNSITVANHKDDYGISASSVFRNPFSLHADRELPEIAANGTSVSAVGITKSGTSFASPAVAGAAALLQSTHSGLLFWPEGIRALLLAGAMKNVSGDNWYSDLKRNKIDARDGAGAMNIEESIHIAKHFQAKNNTAIHRGWGIGKIDDTEFIEKDSTFDYKIKVPQTGGTHVKVALAWDKILKSADAFWGILPLLPLDLDLLLYRNGKLVSWSNSFDNSYEIAEFDANHGDELIVKIRKWAGTGWTYYGIAWTVY